MKHLRTSDSLNDLLQHVKAGSLSSENIAHWLTAEVEAVRRLEDRNIALLQSLLMVENHHLAGVAIYAGVSKTLAEGLPRPVDGEAKE